MFSLDLQGPPYSQGLWEEPTAAALGWRRAALHPHRFSPAEDWVAIPVPVSKTTHQEANTSPPPPKPCSTFLPQPTQASLPPLPAWPQKGMQRVANKPRERGGLNRGLPKRGYNTPEPKKTCEKPCYCQAKYSRLDSKGKRDPLSGGESYTGDVAGKEEAA